MRAHKYITSLAIEKGHLDIIRYLIDKKSDVNCKNYLGNPAVVQGESQTK